MDEKVAEEIRDLKESLPDVSNSPLHQIREKEMEISGRVLSAKREADEIVAEARKTAAEIVRAAEVNGGASAADREREITAAAERDAEKILADAEMDAAELRKRIDARRDQAVELVLQTVTTV